MINLQSVKTVVLKNQGTAATNATASAQFSRVGYDFAQIEVISSPANATATSVKMQALSLNEGDAATGAWTAFGAFTGTTNSTATTSQFVIPASTNTSTDVVHRFNVDLKARKSNIQVVYEPHGSTTADDVTILAHLSKYEDAPVTSTQCGVNLVVTG